MLEFAEVTVSVGDVPILDRFSLTVGAGETHVLLGPNGSGKSTVLSAVMGLDPYEVVGGSIRYRGMDLSGLSTSDRAQRGLGMAFQRPPSLQGVSVAEFASAVGGSGRLQHGAQLLDLGDFLERDVAVGFSGGEIKRWEVLKLFLQQPDFLLFDEPESGVDLEHIAAVGAAISQLVAEPASDGTKRGALLITHTGLILDYVDADRAHIMNNGQIVHSGAPKRLFKHIQERGYVAPE